MVKIRMIEELAKKNVKFLNNVYNMNEINIRQLKKTFELLFRTVIKLMFSLSP